MEGFTPGVGVTTEMFEVGTIAATLAVVLEATVAIELTGAGTETLSAGLEVKLPACAVSLAVTSFVSAVALCVEARADGEAASVGPRLARCTRAGADVAGAASVSAAAGDGAGSDAANGVNAATIC